MWSGGYYQTETPCAHPTNLCRACKIKNTPLPAKYMTLEEDLLPMLPDGGASMGMVQIQVKGLSRFYWGEGISSRGLHRVRMQAWRCWALVLAGV